MRTVAIEEHASTPEVHEATGSRLPPHLKAAMNDIGEQRLANMDEAGIDVAVLSPPPPFAVEDVDDALYARACVTCNDAAARVIAEHPDRYSAFAAVPVADSHAAARELERAVSELGFRGTMIGTRTKLGFVSEEANWPLFEAAESLGVPVYIHPSMAPRAVVDAQFADLGPFLGLATASALWGWHVDTGLHTLRLILRGVFDRFPRLQVIVGHMGEALPFMLGRIESVFSELAELRPPGFEQPFEKPIRQYFRDNIHFTTSGFFDDTALLCALSAVGAERLMFAVDYPYNKNADGRAFLDRAPIGDADREAIAHGNADRLLRLSHPTAG